MPMWREVHLGANKFIIVIYNVASSVLVKLKVRCESASVSTDVNINAFCVFKFSSLPPPTHTHTHELITNTADLFSAASI